MPVAIEGDGKVQRVIVERTTLDDDLRSHGTGETYAVDAGLVISCIGYQTPPIPGVPYEHGRGRFASDDGRILPGLYAVGWARRGPSGTIGTKIGRAHVCTPVTNAQLVCRLLLDKKKQ